MTHNIATSPRPRVVIVGAGFGGPRRRHAAVVGLCFLERKRSRPYPRQSKSNLHR